MTYQLATAKVWDGAAWVEAEGGGTQTGGNGGSGIVIVRVKV